MQQEEAVSYPAICSEKKSYARMLDCVASFGSVGATKDEIVEKIKKDHDGKDCPKDVFNRIVDTLTCMCCLETMEKDGKPAWRPTKRGSYELLRAKEIKPELFARSSSPSVPMHA